MREDAVFRVLGLNKSFGPIAVLKGIDLVLAPGKVTVLMGANGAGKSTLVRIICGMFRFESGCMELAGVPFAPATPSEAIRAGVVTVHQNINDGVVADLNVATNLVLDRLAGGEDGPFFNPRKVRRQAKAIADGMGLDLDLDANVAGLSLADRQLVAIARAMARQPRVLILDEPTSSLSSAEANRLFDLVSRLRDQGVAILYISHRMSDIRRLADRIISLRDGVITGTFETEPLDYEGAVDAMLGRQISKSHVVVKAATAPVFSAENLTIAAGKRPFSMTLGRGEIVAITGLVGVGKTALAETIFGLRPPVSGQMRVEGDVYAPNSPHKAIAQGVFLIAKDRGTNGIVGDLDITGNISLPFLPRYTRYGVLTRGPEQAVAQKLIDELGIVCRSHADMMTTLSGGNQQKVMVARWLSQAARLLILDEPFQGVDIAARRDIANKLRDTADERATLLLLTEIDEAFEVADRILVMSEHTLVGEHTASAIDMDQLLAEITGHRTAGQVPAGNASTISQHQE